jgi:hypothetical protein
MTRLRVSLLPLVLLLILGSAGSPPSSPAATQTRDDGMAAWREVYSVLTHPRCLNCHTAGDYPQQGDTRERHLINVVRGPKGEGVPGLNCNSCHQQANDEATGVPGSAGWHLAPASMAWQDVEDRVLSSAQVCRTLTDRSKNHNMDGPALLKHHAEDALVGWAWQPGVDLAGKPRTTPPLTRAQFVEATRQWVGAGTPCPAAD